MPRQGIAVVNRATSIDRLSVKDRAKVFDLDLDFLSARLQGDLGGVLGLLDEAEDHGLERRGHIWVGDAYPSSYPYEIATAARLNMDAAKELGEKLTLLSLNMTLERIELNGESALFRGPMLAGRRWVAAAAVSWVDEVLANYHGDATIDSLMYTSTRQYYLGPEAALRMVGRVRRHCPMVYQRDPETIKNKLTKATDLWGDDLNPYIGVGRIDSRGNVVGNDDAWLAVIASGGWPISELTHYFGNGSEQMFVEGHDRHRPLIHQVPMLAAAAKGHV